MMRVFAWLVFMVTGSGVAFAEQPSLMERAFFYNDIHNFRGRPYQSPAFGEIQSLSQPFVSNCSNLNRVTIPFYLTDDSSKGTLTFNLRQTRLQTNPIFSTTIYVDKFPPPAKIGTHRLNGVLYAVWFPLQPDSKNQSYLWELISYPDNPTRGVGIYLTHSSSSQTGPVLIDGDIVQTNHAAFYSYCQFRFEWARIFKESGERLWREKKFLFFYLCLMAGLGAYYKKCSRK